MPAPAPRRAAVAFIFITVVLDVLSLGIIIPVLPKLVESFLGGDTQQAARMYGLFGTVWALMQFVFSPLLGVLSDRFGRRPILLLSITGLGLDYCFMALAPSLRWLFVGRIISGIAGASYTTAAAYIADVTPPEKRAQSYGMIGAAWGLGFILGPALGGLLGASNPRLPFWVAASLSLLNALYGFFVVPESLPREKRTDSVTLAKANPIGSLRLLRSHRELFGLASVATLYFVAHQVLPSVFVLYASYRYGWSTRMVGFTLALVGICSAIVQGGLIKPIVARLGERRALLAGLCFGTTSFLIWAWAPTGRLFWLGIPFGALMGLFGPSIQGMMSRHVSASEQGQLQGANTSLMGLTGMVGPTLFTYTFASFIGARAGLHLPGAPYLLAAALTFSAFLLALRVTRREPDPSGMRDGGGVDGGGGLPFTEPVEAPVA
ncbi:MAG: tetA [Gemmatimonadetes bacterium]|nr:tetA [Gemmatimonadota bacterium]